MERFFFSSAVAVEQQDIPGQPHRLTGYAMKYNVLSHDRGGYRVVFRPGVFGDLHVGETDIKAFYDHDPKQYLGRLANGSLALHDDGIGLKFDLVLPDTMLGRDVAALVERGDVGGMSFGYIPESWGWKNEQSGPIQEHRRGRILEISAVHDPAFPKTEVALHSLTDAPADVLRSLAEWRGTSARRRAARMLRLAAGI